MQNLDGLPKPSTIDASVSVYDGLTMHWQTVLPLAAARNLPFQACSAREQLQCTADFTAVRYDGMAGGGACSSLPIPILG